MIISIKLWHNIGNDTSMKVIKLNTSQSIVKTEKLIIEILKRDINAFKATSKQFLRNNQAYFPDFTGMIA